MFLVTASNFCIKKKKKKKNAKKKIVFYFAHISVGFIAFVFSFFFFFLLLLHFLRTRSKWSLYAEDEWPSKNDTKLCPKTEAATIISTNQAQSEQIGKQTYRQTGVQIRTFTINTNQNEKQCSWRKFAKNTAQISRHLSYECKPDCRFFCLLFFCCCLASLLVCYKCNDLLKHCNNNINFNTNIFRNTYFLG